MDQYTRTRISKVEQLSDFDDEYVYDIGMSDGTLPYFFANGILVHNSCYFTTNASNLEDAVSIADGIAEHINSVFPSFMRKAFNCQPGFDDLIKAGREVVAVRGLFQAKKKYMLKVVDLEGKKVDKIKAMGSEIKKSDTPKLIQGFLKTLVDMILGGKPYEEVEQYVNTSRKTLVRNTENVLSLAVTKSANNLDEFTAVMDREKIAKLAGKQPTVPGHVRAAINYNRLEMAHAGPGGTFVGGGDKVSVLYLKNNHLKLNALGFPSDLTRMPDWVEEEGLVVDLRLTEEKMIDSKLKGIFDALGKDVPHPQLTHVNKVLNF